MKTATLPTTQPKNAFGRVRQPMPTIQPLNQRKAGPTPALELRGVCVAYDAHVVLSDINFQIAPGHLVGLLGPNGSGKTTLIKAILGLLPAQKGEVLIHGVPFARSRQAVAYIPQQDTVNQRFPATVYEVVMMGRTRLLGWLRRPGLGDRHAVEHALAQVRMAEWRDASFQQLSGGQQQRVFLARALAQEADLLLLDEPVSGVDAPSRELFYDLLAELRAAGKAILLSTHDLHERIERYDCLLMLNHRVVAYGPPAQVFTQAVLEEAYGQRVVTADGQVSTVLSLGGH